MNPPDIALIQWVQVVVPIVTVLVAAFAAGASALSARASLRTAGTANETARNALEALGRATKPLLSVNLLTDSAQFLSREPAALMLDIVNNGSNRGVLLDARVIHTGGFTASPTVSLPLAIGSTAVSYTERHALTVPMGAMSRLLPDVTEDADSSELITVEVIFADIGRVMTWRQRSQWRERVGILADGRPNYSYLVEHDTEPEIVTDGAASY